MHNGNITGYREHVSNAVNLCQMLNMCQHLIMCHWNLNMGQMLSNVSNCVNFLTLFTCEKELQIVSQYSSDRNLLSAMCQILYYCTFMHFLNLFPTHSGYTRHAELPWLGIEPMPPALEVQSLNHWTTEGHSNKADIIMFPFQKWWC